MKYKWNPTTDNNYTLLKEYEEVNKVGLKRRYRFGAYVHLLALFSESMVAALDFRLREKYDKYSNEQIRINLEKE